MPLNIWKIPHSSKTPEYMRCWYICRRENKPWPELTEKEREKRPWDSVRPADMDQVTESILSTLSAGIPKTRADLARDTGISPRKISYGIKKLREKGQITEKINWADARQMLYQRKSALPGMRRPGNRGRRYCDPGSGTDSNGGVNEFVS